ncbi:hypothetical protein RvY_10210 [Ramazzottius varieornatus]|uniref:Protein farnesyltransferase/geranylgeranyltransferase type-1 subunit alpha n=1 Tax=Ramazzottius varieornatus TaxID=947166 RepID=A0A1D1VC10_RAMVA|nr:hypothetical protein RvY_10210 [Ramazzottius varieornatus]
MESEAVISKGRGQGDAETTLDKEDSAVDLMIEVDGAPTKSADTTKIQQQQQEDVAMQSGASESDSEESDDECTSILFEELPEWKDVTPVALVVGSVMPIAFEARFQSVFGYFRAISASGELSERGLQVATQAAKLNAANYAVWVYRRKALAFLKRDLNVELSYISRVIEKHPKNYQVWYHRQRIVELLKDWSKELDFAAKILKNDAKNYHVWQYRQHILRHFQILDHSELQFTDRLLQEDVFNNSAWMHRFFVLDNLPKACGKETLLEGDSLAEEIRYTIAHINAQVHNESPWSYLRGLLRDNWKTHFSTVNELCKGLYNQEHRSPHLLGFMVDLLDEDIANGYTASTADEKGRLLQKLVEICNDLAQLHDRVRQIYWTWIRDTFQFKYHKQFLSETVPEV